MTSDNKSGGWFHSLKKAFQHTTHNATPHTSDPEFDVAKENFTKLNDTVFRLRDKLNNYIQHAYGLFSNSNGATLDFVTLLEDSSTPHPWSSILSDVKISHSKLVGDRETALAHLLSEECLLKLDQEIELYKELNKRIVIRNEMLGELDYYVNKVDGLKKERDDRLAKGKDEKPTEADKFERNIRKMEEKKNAFTAYNAGVVVDMTTCYRNRVLLLGPVLGSFLKIEKELCKFYSEAMMTVRLVDQKDADEGLNRLRSSSQQEAANQLTEQQRGNPLLNTNAILLAGGSSSQRRNSSSGNGGNGGGPANSNTTQITSSSAPSPPLPPPSSGTFTSSTPISSPAPPAPVYTTRASTPPMVNPLSGMNMTPLNSTKSSSGANSGGETNPVSENLLDKQFASTQSSLGSMGGGGEKRNSMSSNESGAGTSMGGGEKNPFESSLEAEKRNQAVFNSTTGTSVADTSSGRP